tara:strand:- start:22243 stop:22677 length:435 start_codon:yes stop_codon:yes gene_type:complete
MSKQLQTDLQKTVAQYHAALGLFALALTLLIVGKMFWSTTIIVQYMFLDGFVMVSVILLAFRVLKRDKLEVQHINEHKQALKSLKMHLQENYLVLMMHPSMDRQRMPKITRNIFLQGYESDDKAVVQAKTLEIKKIYNELNINT